MFNVIELDILFRRIENITDPDAAHDYIQDLVSKMGRPITQTEFIKEFNQGLANAKLEQWTEEGLIESPTAGEMRETIMGGEVSNYRTIKVRGYIMHRRIYLKDGGIRLKKVEVKPYERRVKL